MWWTCGGSTCGVPAFCRYQLQSVEWVLWLISVARHCLEQDAENGLRTDLRLLEHVVDLLGKKLWAASVLSTSAAVSRVGVVAYLSGPPLPCTGC